MAITMKVGGWYRSRDGQVVRCYDRSMAFNMYYVQRTKGDVYWHKSDGTHMYDVKDCDIVEELPDYTKFDMAPPPCEAGYRYLNSDELLVRGDQYVCCDYGKWQMRDVNVMRNKSAILGIEQMLRNGFKCYAVRRLLPVLLAEDSLNFNKSKPLGVATEAIPAGSYTYYNTAKRTFSLAPEVQAKPVSKVAEAAASLIGDPAKLTSILEDRDGLLARMMAYARRKANAEGVSVEAVVSDMTGYGLGMGKAIFDVYRSK